MWYFSEEKDSASAVSDILDGEYELIGFKNRTHRTYFRKNGPTRRVNEKSENKMDGWMIPVPHDLLIRFSPLPAHDNTVRETRRMLREDYEVIAFANKTHFIVYKKFLPLPSTWPGAFDR